MDKTLGDSFRKVSATVALDEVLKASDFVGVYFSAHWCPPCRAFTPILSEFYKKVNEASKVLEVVFCSSDGNDAAFERYFAEMPWLAVPYGDHRISNLK
jgi:nucleoredoxin